MRVRDRWTLHATWCLNNRQFAMMKTIETVWCFFHHDSRDLDLNISLKIVLAMGFKTSSDLIFGVYKPCIHSVWFIWDNF